MAARLTAVHRHPSLHCYKNHGCRCFECRLIGSQYTRAQRAARKKRVAASDRSRTFDRRRGNRAGGPLGEEELARLRRAVGLE